MGVHELGEAVLRHIHARLHFFLKKGPMQVHARHRSKCVGKLSHPKCVRPETTHFVNRAGWSCFSSPALAFYFLIKQIGHYTNTTCLGQARLAWVFYHLIWAQPTLNGPKFQIQPQTKYQSRRLEPRPQQAGPELMFLLSLIIIHLGKMQLRKQVKNVIPQLKRLRWRSRNQCSGLDMTTVNFFVIFLLWVDPRFEVISL